MPSDRTRGNGHKLKYRKFFLNVKKPFSTVRVGRHGNILLREVVESLCVEIFKTQLNMAVSKLLPLTLLRTVGLD